MLIFGFSFLSRMDDILKQGNKDKNQVIGMKTTRPNDIILIEEGLHMLHKLKQGLYHTVRKRYDLKTIQTHTMSSQKANH